MPSDFRDKMRWRMSAECNGFVEYEIDGGYPRLPSDSHAAIHVNMDRDGSNFGKYTDSLFGKILKDTLRAEPGYPQDLWIPMEERKKKFPSIRRT